MVAATRVRPQRTRNDSVLLECFSHWVAILGLNAQVGSRADVIRRTAQNILPQWLHRHIDRALAALPDDEIPSGLAVPKIGTSCVDAQNTEECRFCALTRCLFAWTYAVDRKKRNRRVVSHSLLRWELVRKKQMIVGWGACLRRVRQMQHKVMSFKELTTRKLTKMMVIHWKQMLDLKNLLSWVAHVLHGNLKRRTCAAWCKYLWYRMATRQRILRATKTVNRNKLKRAVLMWHVNAFMQRLRNRWLLSTSRSVLRGKLWRAALSWRYVIRMKAASRHKVEWFFVQRSRAILRRLLWAWAQYLRTCRDSISILVQSQGRSAAKAAQEAIERTTMLEWLYKQQFRAVYRVQMERAAVLVERKRLLRVVCSWKCAIERHHWHINLTSEWCQKRGMTWLKSTFRSWSALTWVSASLLARKIGFLEREQKGKSKTAFKIWKRRLHKNKTGRHNMTRAATMVYERWVTRLLNHVLTKWFRCSEVARASQCVFLNLTNIFTFIYCLCCFIF